MAGEKAGLSAVTVESKRLWGAIPVWYPHDALCIVGVHAYVAYPQCLFQWASQALVPLGLLLDYVTGSKKGNDNV